MRRDRGRASLGNPGRRVYGLAFDDRRPGLFPLSSKGLRRACQRSMWAVIKTSAARRRTDAGTGALMAGTGKTGALGAAVRVGTFAAAALAVSAVAAHAAQPLLGQPTPGGIGFQPSGDDIKSSVVFFHNDILMPIITAICLLVLGLIGYIAIKFNAKANPVPAQFTHNTQVEIVWTVAPVLILMFIAIFSFRLLYAYHDMPKPDMTVKATGNQWYWNYTYPDHGGFNFDSLILPEPKALAVGKPYRLGVDNPLVVPVGATVRVLVTGADVIHDFALPAFGLKMDAVPGKINETWFKPRQTGIYYGQCSELCGVDHAFMPIEIDVVDRAKFNAWVVGHGGKLSGVTPLGAGGGSLPPQNPSTSGAGATTMPAGATVGPTTAAPAAPAPAAAPPPAAQTHPAAVPLAPAKAHAGQTARADAARAAA